jgi:hypothetical protein
MSVNARNLEVLQHFPLHPVASETTTFTGATTNIADLGQLEGDVQIILDAGAVTGGGTVTGKIQHSNTTTGGDFEDLAGATFTAVAAAASKQVLTVSDVDRRRYIRFVGTVAGTVTCVYSIQGYGVKKYM